MTIVVIGGTGRIGSKLVGYLTEQGHKAVAAAPDTGVNTLTTLYYGVHVSERTLAPNDGAKLGAFRFDDWIGQEKRKRAA